MTKEVSAEDWTLEKYCESQECLKKRPPVPYQIGIYTRRFRNGICDEAFTRSEQCDTGPCTNELCDHCFLKDVNAKNSKDVCIDLDGLFRVSGKRTTTDDIVTALTTAPQVPINSAQEQSEAIKRFLRELKQPVVSPGLIKPHIDLFEGESLVKERKEEKVLAAISILNQLPQINLNVVYASLRLCTDMERFPGPARQGSFAMGTTLGSVLCPGLDVDHIKPTNNLWTFMIVYFDETVNAVWKQKNKNVSWHRKTISEACRDDGCRKDTEYVPRTLYFLIKALKNGSCAGGVPNVANSCLLIPGILEFTYSKQYYKWHESVNHLTAGIDESPQPANFYVHTSDSRISCQFRTSVIALYTMCAIHGHI